MIAYVRRFEKDLIQARTQLAKQRRHQNPNAIFRDLKPPRALPVQILLAKQVCTVEEVLPEEHAVLVDQAFECDSHNPVMCNEMTRHVVHAEDRQLWFDEGSLPSPGTVLWQHKFQGSLTEMFAAFGQEWSQRWCKHDETPDGRWQAIVSFAQHVLPSTPMTFPPLTGSDLLASSALKKVRAATGPDGFSIRDLKNAPPRWHDSLATLLNNVEAGQPWPVQLLEGHITAIEKSEHAADVAQFRPICVLSATYRSWATVRAKALLQQLLPRTPAWLFGSAPKKSATDMVTALQMAIESSYALQAPVTGAVIDLVKCFNTLPRIPLIAVGRALGMPSHIAQAWMSSLLGLQRRFKIRQAVGPSLPSSTGFAEGDPLSVVAMVFSNVLADWYLHYESPSIHLWAYVDNIEITGPSSQHVQHGMGVVQKFCQQLDVTIDPKKSYYWSTCATDRHALRTGGALVCTAQRDLGGHMSYSRRHTNFTITAKCKDMKETWSRLARSQAPVMQKHKAILVAAWPRCLHGIGTVHLGNQHLQDLRSGAMKGIGASKKGANSQVHLSLCSDTRLDPGFFALLASVKSFRKYHDPDTAPLIFEDCVRGTPKAIGPVATLANRLRQVCWHWCEGLSFVDHIGLVLHLVDVPWQVLVHRLRRAWQDSCAEKAQTRPTFEGLAQCDPQFTMQHLHALPQTQLTLMQRALNGTFYTNDKLLHAGKTSTDQCTHCGQRDSAEHRYWKCPHFAAFRSQPTPEVLEFLPLAAPVTLHHGWIGRNLWEDDWLRLLHALPDQTADYISGFHRSTDHWDIFTDGSGWDPKNPLTRIASWGVVLGTRKPPSTFAAIAPTKQIVEPTTLEVFSYYPLAAGFLSGIHQTVLRAELTGAIAAFQWGVTRETPIRLWCDNQRVCAFIWKCQAGADEPSPLVNDHDLLLRLRQLVLHSSQSQSAVIKVAAHQTASHEMDPADLFAFMGNDQAHHVANNARLDDRFQLWPLWKKLKENEDFRCQLRHFVHENILRISSEAVMKKVDSTSEVLPGSALGTLLAPSFLGQIQDENWEDEKLSLIDTAALKSWIAQLRDETIPLRWVSLLEILLAFQDCTESLGVEIDKRSRSWRLIPTTSWRRDGLLMSHQCRTFAKFLRYFSRTLGITYNAALGRSNSAWYPTWSSVCRVHWPSAFTDIVEAGPKSLGVPVLRPHDVMLRH